MENALNIGRRARLIRRDPTGNTSLYTGVITGETDLTWTIKTERGEDRSEPKIYCTIEWLSPKVVGV